MAVAKPTIGRSYLAQYLSVYPCRYESNYNVPNGVEL